MPHWRTTLILLAALASPLSLAQSAPPASAPAAEVPQYWVGVAVENIPASMARLLKLESGQGLLVVRVVPGSPAEKAQLQTGDLLIKLNGKPLTSQRQLGELTNASVRAKDGTWKARPATLEFIRDGDRSTLEITPATRPTEMRIAGNARSFQPGTTAAGRPETFILPNNGGTVQVGPGIVMDLSAPGNENALSVKSIRGIVNKGQTIVLTQETDNLGNVHTSVTIGDKTYDTDPASLAQLPPEIRQLVQPFLAQQSAASTNPVALEQHIKEQDKKIEALTRRIDELLKQLEQKQSGSGSR